MQASNACKNVGMEIRIATTEVLHQAASDSTNNAPSIKYEGQILPAVEQFTYLGSTLPKSANLDDKVTTSLSRAHSAFGRLQDIAWEEFQPRQKYMPTMALHCAHCYMDVRPGHFTAGMLKN